MSTTYKIIGLDKMKVDSSYQRFPNDKRIKTIAKKWDDMKANLIHVSKRVDGYYVIDGNHTRLAAELAGKINLPCRVYEGLTIEQEAALFSELNNSQKKPTFAEMLKANALSGKQPEKGYVDCLDQAGLEYSLTKSQKGKIKCHSALFDIYKTTSHQQMLRAMKTAKLAAADRSDFFQTGFFPGLCSLIVLHPEIDDERLIKKINATTAIQVRELAKGFMATVFGGGSSITTNGYRKAYIKIYNTGLRKNKIVEDK